jgi:hypothetical protein
MTAAPYISAMAVALIPAFVAEAQYIAPAAGAKPATNGGRWRINAGSAMVMEVEGINDAKPIRCVINLATVQIPQGRIPTLRDHDEARVVGFWSNFTASDAGLDADLTLIDPADGSEAEALPDVVEMRAMLRTGVPMQASVGGAPASAAGWKQIPAGTVLAANGRDYAAEEDDEFPLYAIEGLQLKETSLCLWGADRRTGPIAAKAIPTKKDTPMPADLKAMKTKYAGKSAEIRAMVADLVADEKTEADIAEAVHAAEMKALTDKVAAKDAEITTLKASAADKGQDKGKDQDGAESGKPPGFSASDGSGNASQAKTWGEARALLAAENPKLSGRALNEMVARRFPKLSATDHKFTASPDMTGAGKA